MDHLLSSGSQVSVWFSTLCLAYNLNPCFGSASFSEAPSFAFSFFFLALPLGKINVYSFYYSVVSLLGLSAVIHCNADE
jgi:hypothetical protein